jgi:hypothetical protein
MADPRRLVESALGERGHMTRAGIVPRSLGLLLLVVLSTPGGTARASDGRHEISHAAILAAGGYPHVITQPGSYVLTSNLAPPANEIGIRIDTDDVAIDLNGFAIGSDVVCVPQSCSGSGPSYGITASPSITASGRRCTVRNGTIRGVGIAVNLRDDALAEGLVVSNTSSNGIVLGPYSLARANRVSAVGRSGLFLGAGSGYSENVISRTGQFFAFGSVSGGTQVGRNSCDDGRCPPRRRFYITSATTNGSGPTTACEPGFHFASAAEISDPTQLQYFSFYASQPVAGGGGGIPFGRFGWIREDSSRNCNNWTYASSGYEGSLMYWRSTDDPASVSGVVFGPGWNAAYDICNLARATWCVED